jgi:hypothetical protein
MPSTTNLEGEEIVDAPGKDVNMSMPEQIKRPNPWRKMMMMNSYSYGLSDCTGKCPMSKNEGSTYDRKTPTEWHSVY